MQVAAHHALRSSRVCGEKRGFHVIFEDPGGGAPSGAGGAGSSSDPESSSGSAGAACQAIRDRYAEAGRPQPGCVEKCRRDDTAACRAERDALRPRTLAEDDVAACAFPAACAQAYVAYVACAGEATGAEPSDCTPTLEGRLPGGVCTAFIECSGVVLTQTCFGDEDDGFDCECAEDGVVVGTCREVEDECDVAGACCESVVTRPGED